MRMRFLGRMIPLFRSIANPATILSPTILDGTPVMAATDDQGVLWVKQFFGGPNGITSGIPQTVTRFSTPALGVVASASLPADGSGHVAFNVCQSMSWTFQDSVATTGRTLVLRDGASGVGTILWSLVLGPLAAGVPAQGTIVFPTGQGIPGLTGATAMTLEFTAAPSATGQESCAITGYLSK